MIVIFDNRKYKVWKERRSIYQVEEAPEIEEQVADPVEVHVVQTELTK